MLTLFTSSLRTYAGRDRLDITRATGTFPGIAFAPSREILIPLLQARRTAQSDAVLWTQYTEDYLREMAVSRREHPAAWHNVLSRETVTLCCYCKNPLYCHRSLLGQLLQSQGEAVFRGERAHSYGEGDP